MNSIRKEVEIKIIIDQLAHLYNTLDSIQRLINSMPCGQNADELRKALSLVERIIKEKKENLSELNSE